MQSAGYVAGVFSPTIEDMIAIPVLLLVIALTVAVVAGLAWSANLPGNNVVGIRAPEARKSQENWDITHRVAGPSWAVSAIAFLGAAALSYLAIQPSATSWMWLWVAVAVLAGLAMVGVGAAMGAHTIALYDAKLVAAEEAESGCCGGTSSADSCGTDSCGTEAADSAADAGCSGSCSSCTSGGLCGTPPQVDHNALRRAAEKSDTAN